MFLFQLFVYANQGLTVVDMTNFLKNRSSVATVALDTG